MLRTKGSGDEGENKQSLSRSRRSIATLYLYPQYDEVLYASSGVRRVTHRGIAEELCGSILDDFINCFNDIY